MGSCHAPPLPDLPPHARERNTPRHRPVLIARITLIIRAALAELWSRPIAAAAPDCLILAVVLGEQFYNIFRAFDLLTCSSSWFLQVPDEGRRKAELLKEYFNINYKALLDITV